MRPLPNYTFSDIQDYAFALNEIERHIRLLIEIVSECDDVLSDSDREQFVKNINWLKRFYESAERTLLNDVGT